MKLSVNQIKRKSLIILLLGISCMVEQHLLDISYNPFLIALLADNAYYGVHNTEVLI